MAYKGKKRGGWEIEKFEYLENEKSFLDEIESIESYFFIVFEGPSFGANIKIWWKIADTIFNKAFNNVLPIEQCIFW